MKELKDELDSRIHQMQCPYEFDVIEDVMSQIYHLPKRVSLWHRWGRYAAAVAAVLVVGAGVWLYVGNNNSFNELQISSSCAMLYDFNEYTSPASSYIEEIDYLDLYNYNNEE